MNQQKSNITKRKICNRCKTPFECSTQNCWCSKLPVLDPLIPGEDCLCPECLKKAIEDNLNGKRKG